MSDTTRTSIDGMIAILTSEAVVLSAYDDGVGVWTIGVGHTAKAGQPHPKPGLKLTLRQALMLFTQDLRKFETGVMKAFTTPLQQHEFDGFVSFHFNTGQAERGTVDDKWDAGNKTGAMKTLLSYNKGGGKVMDGLKTRRAEEKAMIMEGHYPAVKKIKVADKAHRGKFSGVRMVPVDEIKAVLREILAGGTAPAQEITPAEAATDENSGKPEGKPGGGAGGGKAAAGGVAGAVATGGSMAAAGLPWTWIVLGAGIVAFIIFIGLLAAKKEKAK